MWIRTDSRREQQIQQVLLRWIVPEQYSDAPKDQPTVPAEYLRPPSWRDIQRVVAVLTCGVSVGDLSQEVKLPPTFDKP
jgi:hypothetical protein